MKPLEPWDTFPTGEDEIGEIINRFPAYVAWRVQYRGLQLSQNCLDQLKDKLDGPSYRAVLKTSQHFSQ